MQPGDKVQVQRADRIRTGVIVELASPEATHVWVRWDDMPKGHEKAETRVPRRAICVS